MSDNTFVYVTYIRTTPEKLWTALTDPEFNRQFFLCSYQESDWKVGSSWKLIFPDGRVADSGEILEIDPPRRLVIKWRNEWLPEVKEDGYTRCTFTIEKDGELMKLAVTHEADGPHR
ncbi:MAG: ATPase, partial [Mesorhizobium sp.]